MSNGLGLSSVSAVMSWVREIRVIKARLVALCAAILAGNVLFSAGPAAAGIPVGVVTPMPKIGLALINADIELALRDEMFRGALPRPIAVAAVPPSLIPGADPGAPGTTIEGTTIEDGELAQLEPPPLTDSAAPRVPGAPPYPKRKPPVPVTTADTPSAAPPTQAPPSDLVAIKASAYERFQNDLLAISKLRLDKSKDLNRAVALLKNHEPNGLSQGWMAHGAKIAAGTKDYQTGLRAVGRKSGGHKRLFKTLESKPNQIHGVKGAAKAQQQILSAVAVDIAVMRQLSHRLLEVAYERTGDEARLSAAASTSGRPTFAALQSAGVAPTVPQRTGANGWPLITQMLTLAAHMRADANSAANESGRLVAHKKNDSCMKWAKSNLAQCLAAARLNSEKAFCLSKHALDERADCLNAALK